MSKSGDTYIAAEQMSETKDLLLQAVQRFSWFLLVFLIGGSWYMFDWSVAQSILIGGLLANISFFMLRRDTTLFMANFSEKGTDGVAVKKIEKVKFFLKFYGRLTVLAVVICLIIAKMTIDVIGLIIGLSTIMFSIIVVSSKGSILYSAQRIKGA